jgi:hypothetical protein
LKKFKANDLSAKGVYIQESNLIENKNEIEEIRSLKAN